MPEVKYMHDRWENDFILTSSPIRDLEQINVFAENGFFLYTKMPIAVEGSNKKTIVLGSLYDIRSPHKNKQEIMCQLANKEPVSNEFFNELAFLSGRYLLILFAHNKAYVITDAAGLIHVFRGEYQDQKTITSNVNIANFYLSKERKISEKKSSFIISQDFKNAGYKWLGINSPDENYSLVLPNYVFEINSGKTFRIPLSDYQDSPDYTEIVDTFAQWMINSLEAVKNHTLMIPVTAGIDSRIIYAAAKNVDLKAEYYLFDTGHNESDIQYGKMITEIGGDKISIYPEEKPPQDFLDYFKSLTYYFTEIDRVSHYYHHFIHDEGKINVNGNGGDIIRGYYAFFDTSSGRKISDYFGYHKWNIFEKDLDKWLSELPQEGLLKAYDYLYWEIKTANWFGRYQYEKNHFIQDYSPYTNRALLMLGFQVPFHKRRAYVNTFQKDIVQVLFPGLNKLPINPEKSLVGNTKLVLYKNYTIWWMYKKIYHKLSMLY